MNWLPSTITTLTMRRDMDTNTNTSAARERKTVTLRNSTWHRGTRRMGNGLKIISALRTVDDHMCCLGVCAIDTHDIPVIAHQGTPRTIADVFAKIVDTSTHYARVDISEAPDNVKDYVERWCQLIAEDHVEMYHNNSLAARCMEINDAESYDEVKIDHWPAERQKRYRALNPRNAKNMFAMSGMGLEKITDEDRVTMLRPFFEQAGYELIWLPNE
jgi:hypothetical protein